MAMTLCTATGSNYFLGKPHVRSRLGLLDNAEESGDHFLPGSEFESWSFGEIGGEPTVADTNGKLFTGLNNSLTVIPPTEASAVRVVFSCDSADQKLGLVVVHEVTPGIGYVKMSITITNRHLTPIKPYYARKYDPDQDYDYKGTYFTNNTLERQGPTSSGAWFSAVGKQSGGTSAYFAPGANSCVSFHGRFSPIRYSGFEAECAAFDESTLVYADDAVGIVLEFGTIAPRRSVTRDLYLYLTDNVAKVAQCIAAATDEIERLTTTTSTTSPTIITLD